jgi:hypothetical protein
LRCTGSTTPSGNTSLSGRQASTTSPPHIRDTEGANRLVACIRESAHDGDRATVGAALRLLWATQHLDNLWRLESHLGERANAARVDWTGSSMLRRLRLA